MSVIQAQTDAVVGAAREVVRVAKNNGSDIVTYQSFAILDAEIRELDTLVSEAIASHRAAVAAEGAPSDA